MEEGLGKCERGYRIFERMSDRALAVYARAPVACVMVAAATHGVTPFSISYVAIVNHERSDYGTVSTKEDGMAVRGGGSGGVMLCDDGFDYL